MSKVPESSYRGFDTYTKTDHHTYVKENFKVLANLLEEHVKSGRLVGDSRLLDVGCATGALIAYLMTRFPEVTFDGLDISEELIENAREKVPQARFEVGSVDDLPEWCANPYDIALLIGVLGIFDEDKARDALYRLLGSVRKGGVIYVFHQFNEMDIDVMVKHRRVEPDNRWEGWGAGWNNYSYRTIGEWLEGRCESHRFIDFSMPFELEPQDNPVRTWTIEMPDGSYRLTNGLKLLVDLRFLEIIV